MPETQLTAAGVTQAPQAAPPSASQEAAALIEPLARLRAEMVALEVSHNAEIAALDIRCRRSAVNLLQYLALRRHDLRALQPRLARLGLSSLGRSEAHALATLEAVLCALHLLAGREAFTGSSRVLGFDEGHSLLDRHAGALFGPEAVGRRSRIMVTMPAEAATDFKLVRDLVEAGMNVMRVNCAHDGPDAWLRMIRNLRRACRATGRQASVLMDLGGPKLRTGTFPPGPSAVKVSPARDARGKLLAPARVLLVSARPAGLPPDIDAELRVPQALIAALKPGAKLRVTDTRGRARVLSCLEAGRGWRLLAATKSCYFDNGVKLRAPGDKRFKLSGLACAPGEITLAAGELVALTADPRPARVEPRTLEGRERRVAIIPCTLPEVIAQVRVGEPVWFDDGKIGGIVARADATELLIEVTQCREGGARLAGDKGINFPASDLKLSALTAKDREDLRFVARHADMVGLSFVNRPEDVTALRRELVELGAGGMGVVLKIETRRGFANLAPILMAALGGYPFGVMIARGDLAVECGFERLAEIQEELLWICEAAHVPVIWATQVLETLAKKGAPTRAEMTDAAMSGRAECVMLNKGPHIVKALSTLDDVLRRMQGHLSKKQAMLRELSVARLDPPVPA